MELYGMGKRDVISKGCKSRVLSKMPACPSRGLPNLHLTSPDLRFLPLKCIPPKQFLAAPPPLRLTA